MAAVLRYGILFALLAGYVASGIVGRSDLRGALIVAAMVAVGAIISMVTRPTVAWSQAMKLLRMTPAIPQMDLPASAAKGQP